MNIEKFKKYALENFEQASLEICMKANNQRITNKIHGFDQAMEKHILTIKDRINNMIDNLTVESYEEKKKAGIIKALSCEGIKALCHKEVYSKIYYR